VIMLAATCVYFIERPAGNQSIQTYGDALWWSTVTLTTVGYGDIYPTTPAGRAVAAALMLTSIGLVGSIGGIITTVVVERVQALKEGRVSFGDLSGHFVFCGWSACAEKTVQMLAEHGVLATTNVVVLSKTPPQKGLDGVQFFRGDFILPANLRAVGVQTAATVVVFHETGSDVDHAMADNKTRIAALQIHKTNPEVHIVAEFVGSTHMLGLGHLGDRIEAIGKETFDADLIMNTVLNPGQTSLLLYDLADLEGARIETTTPRDLLALEKAGTVGDIRRLMEHSDSILLGHLPEGTTKPVLNPDLDTRLAPDQLIYIIRN